MAYKRQDESGISYAVVQICGLYGVQYTREQSRVLNVQEAGGRWRPMFFGTWVDDKGEKHHGGKGDFLLRPRIRLGGWPSWIPVPLWVECKSGDARTNRKTKFEQMAFENWVRGNGDYYLRLNDDARPLLSWFDEHGVVKGAGCDDAALAAVVSPMDASQLYLLPCKHCKLPRDKHQGAMFACPMSLVGCNPKLIGKVWSPDLRKGVKANAESDSAGSVGAGAERV